MQEIQTVIVLDCSGPLGLQLLHKAIHHDLRVTAYALDPKTIPDNITKRLHRVIQGDVLDLDKVEEAIEDSEIKQQLLESVFETSFLGSHHKDRFVAFLTARKTVISHGCQNIVRAMKKHIIKKLAITTDAITLQGSEGILGRVRKKYGINAEYIQMMDILEKEKESIDWVALMLPKVVISQEVNPKYKVERNGMPGEWSVTSGEVADFLVKVFLDRISTECFLHNVLGISSHPKRSSYSSYYDIMTYMLFFIFALLLYFNKLPPVVQQYIDEVVETVPTEKNA